MFKLVMCMASMLTLAAAAAAAVGGPSTQAASQQATRHARRIYVGGLPPTATEQSISTFFSYALAAVGGNTAGPGGWYWQHTALLPSTVPP
jgi:splicing factor U2AF subunit